MRVGTLGRPGVFKLRSRAGRRKLSDRAPEAPDRRVVFNRVCLGCSAGARISPSAAQIRRHQRLAAQ
jgi:hypothetical protein